MRLCETGCSGVSVLYSVGKSLSALSRGERRYDPDGAQARASLALPGKSVDRYFRRTFCESFLDPTCTAVTGRRSVLIRKHAAHDQYLFAAVVAMGAEAGRWRPSDQGRSGTLAHQRHHAETGDHALVPGGSAGIDNLAACPIQHTSIDACLGARGPRQVLMSQEDSLAVV